MGRTAQVIPLDRGRTGLRARVDLAGEAPFAMGVLDVAPAMRQIRYPDGETETLEPRVMEVLVALARAEGAVLTRDDLTAACWGGTVVGEDAIQRVIQRLRKAANRSGAFRIDTITKVGYRLVAESDGEAARGDAPSLAVLPFVNRSGLAEDESFALGMSDDLIVALAEGVNVRVLASSATARFRDAPPADLPAEGRRLGARYFLEGKVRRAGEGLQVTAQVVEAATSEIVWSQTFERHLDEFALLQGELVTEVASSLGANIYKLEMNRALRKPANLNAWECMARAMAATHEYSADALERATAEARRAVGIAPDYGLAHAMLALFDAGDYFSMGAPDAAREAEIQRTIDRAFTLDPENAGVLAGIAAASAYIGRPEQALPRALVAIRLRRGHGLGHYAAGIARLLVGGEAEGVRHLDDFLRVEPDSHLHYVTHAWRGVAHARMLDFAAARRDFAASLALFPDNFIAKLILTGIDHREGARKSAGQHLSAALALDPHSPRAVWEARLARFFAGSPLRGEMLGALETLWPT